MVLHHRKIMIKNQTNKADDVKLLFKIVHTLFDAHATQTAD